LAQTSRPELYMTSGLVGLLCARRERPRRRTAKRGYQFPPSDADWHVPLSV
jgi:hypothetical protein